MQVSLSRTPSFIPTLWEMCPRMVKQDSRHRGVGHGSDSWIQAKGFGHIHPPSKLICEAHNFDPLQKPWFWEPPVPPKCQSQPATPNAMQNIENPTGSSPLDGSQDPDLHTMKDLGDAPPITPCLKLRIGP